MVGLRKQVQKTIADRLPYFGFDPRTDAIWLKDGSATLSLKVVPKDCSLLTDDDLEVLRSGLTPILNHLPEGSVLQALLIRERSHAGRDEAYRHWVVSHSGSQSDPSRSMLFNARRESLEAEFLAGNVFQTRCYLTLRILPDTDPRPGKTMGAFSHLSFCFQGKKRMSRTRDRILSDLGSAYESFSTGLSALGFDVSHVPHEERVAVIYEWLNPERSRALPPPSPRPSVMLADQVGTTDLVESVSGLALGRVGVEIASLKALPEISIPAAMQELACANIPFSMLLTIYVLPQTEERERLLRKQRLAQGMASGNAVRNLMAEAQLRDIEDTLGALISSGERLLGVSFHMTGIKEGDR